MRRLWVISIAATLLVGAALAEPGGPPASWEDQCRVMGYLIMHLSSINAINGINLDRRQAMELGRLAREVEQAAPRMPSLNWRMRLDLGEVRDAYVEVEKLLLAGQEVPAALEARVGKARAVEAAVIRQSLTSPVAGAASCLRCHTQPQTSDLRGTLFSAATPLHGSARPKPGDVVTAHHLGLFGIVGSLKLLGAIQKVDDILRPEQRQALTSFSCCLTPPKSMSDPVRAGQASGGEHEIDLMRKVRGMNEAQWAITRAIGAAWVDKLITIKSPGATQAEMDAVREKVTVVLEKSRTLADSDFELEKAKLAAELRQAIGQSKEEGEKERKFTTAMFLLMPGSAQAYDALIRRQESRK